MSLRLSWVLVALAGLALLAGCGESEQQKYTSKMKSITKQLRTEQKQVTGGVSPNSLSEAGTQFRQLQVVFNRLGDRFAKVDAPAKVKDLHQRLTALIRSFSNALTPAIQAAESGNTKRFQATATSFKTTLTGFESQLTNLRGEYKARGYKLT
jgi:hypothetical protein